MDGRLVPIHRVLLSVSDKTGLIELAKELVNNKAMLISTGGTKKALLDAGIPAVDISEVTGFPEMLDGRVKTLHPKIHGGILAIRDNAEHVKTIKEHDIHPIDMVICNLYPFAKVASNPESTYEEVVLAQVLAQQIRAVVAVELFQMQRLEPEEKVWLS